MSVRRFGADGMLRFKASPFVLPFVLTRCRNTDLYGTIRKNRKGIPPVISTTKLKRGETCAKQSGDGILLLKWKDKRDIFMLSTKHDGSLIREGKPAVIEQYNKVKGFVDLSDQMAAYTPFVRRTCRWYLRLFFHLLTQTALVNAWHLFNLMEFMSITDFKYSLVKGLLLPRNGVNSQSSRKRRLINNDNLKTDDRRRCKACYKKAQEEHGRAVANSVKKVKTTCSECNGFFCLDCFQEVHTSCSGH